MTVNEKNSATMDYSVDGWKAYIGDRKTLELSKRELTDENIRGLAEVLKTNTNIREIDLSENKLTAAGAVLFADALRINLHIASNPLTDTHVLNFSGNNIGKEGILALAKVFDETNRMFHCLVLGGIGVTEEEADELETAPELIRICEASEKFRRLLYPTGDCVIS